MKIFWMPLKPILLSHQKAFFEGPKISFCWNYLWASKSKNCDLLLFGIIKDVWSVLWLPSLYPRLDITLSKLASTCMKKFWRSLKHIILSHQKAFLKDSKSHFVEITFERDFGSFKKCFLVTKEYVLEWSPNIFHWVLQHIMYTFKLP